MPDSSISDVAAHGSIAASPDRAAAGAGAGDGAGTGGDNVDRARIRGVEIAYAANDVGRDGLDLSSSVTFAGSLITRNEKFSG
jgi:hypothetical protein